MNYEPIFRAKDVNTGEWVTGYYYFENGHFIKDIVNSITTKTFVVDGKIIRPFTQSFDAHGVRIFEGDIVVLDNIKYVVDWRKSEWVFGHIDGEPYSYPYFASHANRCEIIGNRYDNPDLLERSRKE